MTLPDDAFRTYAICSTIVALHLFVLAGWTGAVRARKKQFVNPEDARLNKAEHTALEHEEVDRVKRAHMNLIESAIPFFVVGGLYAATGPSKNAALAYYGTFVGARVLHSIFYLWGRQPFRTIVFVIGVLSILGMAVHVLRAAV